MWGRVVSAGALGVSVELTGVPGRAALPMVLSSGRLARLAPGSAVLTANNELTLLATAARGPPFGSAGGVPLLVDFRAKAASVGVIPATWARREMQPAAVETLTARLVDRALRPAFGSGAGMDALQLTVSVLSAAKTSGVPVDAFSVNAASAAVVTAGVPWAGPVGAARVARVRGEVLAFPSEEELAEADLSLFVAVLSGGRVLSMATEAKADGVGNDQVMEALRVGVNAAEAFIPAQHQLADKVKDMRAREGASSFPRQMPRPALSQIPTEAEAADLSDSVRAQIYKEALGRYEDAFVRCREYPGKAHRAFVITQTQQAIINLFPTVPMDDVLAEAQKASKEAHRSVLLRDRLRMDGRGLSQVRQVRCEAGVLPGDVHGSAIFERGDTQVLGCATIGFNRQSQRTEAYVEGGGVERPFFVHYSFPPYSTGDSGRFAGSTSRRETGHSALAEKALLPLLQFPESTDGSNHSNSTGVSASSTKKASPSPYSIRVSAEVTASDGSSSMGTICASSMALMDAGVPMRASVAGVAMGLIAGPQFPDNDAEDYVVLTDILGAEDHFGDMDMKAAGTSSGLTACQMDIKRSSGIHIGVIARALDDAQTARLHILEKMDAVVSTDRYRMPSGAPRVVNMRVDTAVAAKALMRDRAAGLRDIEDESGARLTLEGRAGVMRIEAPNAAAAEKAQELIKAALGDLEIGIKLRVRVLDVKATYALVETESGSISGLLHVSKMQIGFTPQTVATPETEPVTDDEEPVVERLRFPDARTIVRRGDFVDAVVLESCRARNVLRFGLVSLPPARKSKTNFDNEQGKVSVAETVDTFLGSLRSASSQSGK